jgi:hypothetical protein
MEYSRRARWVGWVIGGGLMVGGGWLLIQMAMALPALGRRAGESWWAAILGFAFMLSLIGVGVALGVFSLYVGYRMVRQPSAHQIRRTCFILAVVAWFLVQRLVDRGGETGPSSHVHWIMMLIGMLVAGVVYWAGSRVMIRYAGVPEVMDEPWRERAANGYMVLVAIMVWIGGGLTLEAMAPDGGDPWAFPVSIGAALVVYFLGKWALIAWDRRMAVKDTPVAALAPEEARRREAVGVVPEYRPAEADEGAGEAQRWE